MSDGLAATILALALVALLIFWAAMIREIYCEIRHWWRLRRLRRRRTTVTVSDEWGTRKLIEGGRYVPYDPTTAKPRATMRLVSVDHEKRTATFDSVDPDTASDAIVTHVLTRERLWRRVAEHIRKLRREP